MRLILTVLTLTLLAGCKTTETPPAVSFTIDVYQTNEGFFVVSERESGESMAVRFNAEILRTDEPITIK